MGVQWFCCTVSLFSLLSHSYYFHKGLGAVTLISEFKRKKKVGKGVRHRECSIFVKGNNLVSQNLEQKNSMN